jgi:hypothetical protein
VNRAQQVTAIHDESFWNNPSATMVRSMPVDLAVVRHVDAETALLRHF